MREDREKHGLAYMVGSLMQTTYYTNPGEWFAYSQTRADKTAEAISLIIDIVKDLRENPVPEAELKRTKDSLINSYVFRFESSTQIAFQQMMLAYRGYASDFLETYSDNIANVTAADVQAVAQKYLRPDALTIVAVGNQANFDRPLDEFGIVNEIGIEQPDPPPAEPIPEIGNTDVAKAQKILAAAVQAHGGLEKLRTVKNIVSEGSVIYQAEQQQITEEIMEAKFYLMYPNKFRQDFKGSLDGEVSYIFDGTSAVVVTSAGKQPLLLEQATVMKDTIPGGGAWLLMHLVQAGGPLHYAGTEEVSGKPASVIHAKQPSGETLKIFIDEATHYMVKIGFRQVEEGVEIETTFEDYRDVAGIKIPYRVIIVFQFQDVEGEYDNRIGKIRVSSVTLNADLDESLFQKPE